ncbi:hypothetical protein OSTOST_13063 [Ostertagia ostertagi]
MRPYSKNLITVLHTVKVTSAQPFMQLCETVRIFVYKHPSSGYGSFPPAVVSSEALRYWNDASPDDKSVMEFEGSQRNATIEGLTPSTHYTVDVMASTVKGDGPREETKFESGVPPELPGRPSSLTLSGYPC